MSFAQVYTRSVVGLHAPKVIIEVHLSQGLPALTIVGLPEAAVRESKDRVRSAILNSGFQFPNRRLTINLAPLICLKMARVLIYRLPSESWQPVINWIQKYYQGLSLSVS